MRAENILAFAHETMPLAQSLALSEIVPTCHSGKIIQLAGIPGAYSPTAVQGQIDFILNVETEACRAHIRAGCTRQAAFS